MARSDQSGGSRFRRREDYAVELFRGIRDHLDDLPRVDRALLELGRFYNPVLNAPIVDLQTRRRVLELLAAARESEARRILDERLALYTTGDEGAGGADGPPAHLPGAEGGSPA